MIVRWVYRLCCYYLILASMSRNDQMEVLSFLFSSKYVRAVFKSSLHPFSPAAPLPLVGRRSMTTELPTSSIDQGDYTYLKKDFDMLSRGNNYINFETFLRWSEIQALVSDDLITQKELKAIWVRCVGSINTIIDLDAFLRVNNELDSLFNIDDTVEDSTSTVIEATVIDSADSIQIDGEQEDEASEDGSDLDVWDPAVSSPDLFEVEFLSYLRSFFDGEVQPPRQLLSFNAFLAWKDVREMLDEGNVDITCLKELWSEALCYKNCATEFVFILESEYELPCYMIDFDTFVRMNFRLEEVMEDIKVALEQLSEQDVEEYYRKEFELLTGGDRLLAYSQLVGWSLVEEMFSNRELTEEQLQSMWAALVKEPIRKDRLNRTGKGFAPPSSSSDVSGADETGITVESFLLLNNAIEDSLSVLNTRYGAD